MSLKSWQIKLFIILGVITLGSGIFLTKMFISLNNLQDLSHTEDEYSNYSVPTRVYDIKGRLITEFYKEKRDIISFKDLPQNLLRAIIATEDNRFYEHNGANFVAMFQGVILDPLRGRGVRGGSGITQQLAKLIFTDSAHSIRRKIIELWYAYQLENKYSKEEILELYFNLIYFGHGQYGIESASKFYFNKSAKDLSLGEASFMAGLPQAPSRYSPIINYKRAQARHRSVLSAMVNNGYISKETAANTFASFWENYDNTFVAANRNIRNEESNPAPFFSEYVRQQALEKYGEELLYSGGLEIYTTLNLDYQKFAKEEVEKALDNEQKLYSSHYNANANKLKSSYADIVDIMGLGFGIDGFEFSSRRTKKLVKETVQKDQDLLALATSMFGISEAYKQVEKLYDVDELVGRKTDQIEGALISINPKNGYIEAMVGGRNFSVANQFNRATQAQRQMGSTFKGLLFAIALDNKIITPSEIFVDEIISYQMPSGDAWTPRNYNGAYLGPMTVRKALRLSVNIVTILIWERILKQVGYSRFIDRLSLFLGESKSNNFERRIPNEMATALGTGTASPLSVAQAYSVIANGGKTVTPISILKVLDRNGSLLDDFTTAHNAIQQQQVISPATATLMQSLLNDVITRGTGAGAARRSGYKYSSQTAGKSGTASNWTDAWFVGFTDKLATVIWIGLDSSSKSLGKGRSSSLVSAPAWFAYMNKVGDLNPPSPLAFRVNRQGLTTAFVSPFTGLRTTEDDPTGYTEYFLSGTAPKSYGTADSIALIQAELNQEDSYTVSGQSIVLDSTVPSTTTTNSESTPSPYTLDNDLEEELDLSFDLSSGL